MDPAPLIKPAHLRPADGSRRSWLAQRPAAAVAAVLGLASFVVVVVAQPAVWSTPDPRISVPGLVVTAIAAVASIARHERGAPLWLAGLGLATAAVVLGWFLMLASVLAVTFLLILMLHAM